MNFMINLVIPTLIISVIALITALASIVLVLAEKWSTHKIEWRPLKVDDPFLEKEPEEQEAISDEEILEKAKALQQRGKRLVDPLEEITQTTNF